MKKIITAKIHNVFQFRFRLFGLYGKSTFVGYLMPNPFL